MSQNLEEYKEGQLLRMTIQIDDQRVEKLDIFDGDEPQQLATDFCKKNHLNQRLIPILTENIQKNMMIANKEKQNMSQYLLKKQEASQVKQLNANQGDSPGLLNSCQSPKSPNQKKGSNVFDRLYQVAQDKKIRQQLLDSDRKPSLNIQNNQSEVNYGEQLYQRGMSQLEILIQKAELNLLEKQQSVMMECTYKPQINQNSSKIVQRSPEPIGSHLNKLAKQISEKKEQALLNQIESEQNQCTFHPKIDKQSEAIIEERRSQTQSNLPHYEQLHRENQIILKKKQEQEEKLFQEKHTFHPKIDAQSEQLVQGINFEERQQKFQELIKNKKPSTDEYFKPKTGRPPEQQRPQNLFETLYSQAQIQAEKKANQLSMSKDQALNMSQVKASQKSEAIAQQSVYNSISQIFDTLDSDQDGEIDALRIDTQNLDPSVLKSLQPFLNEMEAGKYCVQKEEFIQIVFKLMSLMSNKEKHDLLKKQKKPNQYELYSAGKNGSPIQFFKKKT